ncbi:minor histocompatibility antigen H13 [Arthroderma uncinatum]|uniref:minor histocompatibility antigen H13 n=1 Tax=Arthroderma uncinatum TaxID=74035 RepID=UPI00144AC3A2|nr:minor histocompatibility antigen H13 [Arthroderma uncinatum]KAF3491393.1 minor histocompatibility antigen H13 [Arthroderma uncinatum]
MDFVTAEFAILKPLIPTYTHLILSTLFALYIGCHASLSRPSSARKEIKEQDEEDEFDEVVVQKMGGLEPSDAIMFPVLSGITLSGLYLLIKNFDAKYLNKLLNWYFSHASFIFAISFIRDAITIFRSFVFPTCYFHGGALWKANQEKRIFEAVSPGTSSTDARLSPLPGILGTISLPQSARGHLWHLRGVSYQKVNFQAYVRSLMDLKVRFNVIDILGIILSAAVVLFSVFGSRPWWITNFLGFCFSYGALQFMSPQTFWTGTLILSSLFFYDIYFVFYTPMMVTVATKLDIPIKLIFPRPPPPGLPPASDAGAMLGLGDIVVPGLIIGLALRFDLYLYYLRNQKQQIQSDSSEDNRIQYRNAAGGWGERIWGYGFKSSNVPDEEKQYYNAKTFSKTYFTAGVVGYVIGMVATLLSMQLSNHPQPALLFLVPGVLIALWGTAFVKGDVHTMWNFSDEVEDEDEDDTEDESAESSLSEPGFLGKVIGPEWAIWIMGKLGNKSPTSKNGKPGSEGSDVKSVESDKPGDKDDGSKKKSPKEKKPHPRSELISISISLPTEPDGTGQVEEEDQPASEPSSSASPSPVLVAKDEGPPLKKRRGYRPAN